MTTLTATAAIRTTDLGRNVIIAVLAVLSLVVSVSLAGRSDIFATLAAMQIAVFIGIAAGKLVSGR
jgi:hypothetical protein